MSWVGCITDAGRAAFDAYIASGDTININVVKTGSGLVSQENMRSATGLVNQVTTGSLISKTIITDPDDSGVEIKMSVSSYTTPYYLKEVGVFATVTSGGTSSDIMVALFQNEYGILIPDSADFPDFNLILTSILDIDNDADLVITPVPGTYVFQYQGTENAGKFLVVNNQGLVVPTTVPFASGALF